MNKKSQYIQKLEPLLHKPIFSVQEAKKNKVPVQALIYLTKIGTLEKVTRGYYKSSQYEPEIEIQWEQLAEIASTIPTGVICLISALSYYDLTEEIPRQHWIAISNSKKVPKRKNTRIIRMRNIDLGKISIKIGEYLVNIFDKERCIIDAFRYLSEEIAIKALKEYLSNPIHTPSIEKLKKYAEQLRVNIRPYILTITT